MGYVCHVVPSIWVSFLTFDVPQNGSVSESLTHTSGHKAPRVVTPLPQETMYDDLVGAQRVSIYIMTCTGAMSILCCVCGKII